MLQNFVNRILIALGIKKLYNPYTTQTAIATIKAELAKLEQHGNEKLSLADAHTKRIETLKQQVVVLQGEASEAHQLATSVGAIVK